jgi:2-iminobutanoate/2-iminopropanoate deaminase
MSLKREVISTSNAPGAVGPYSQAVKAGSFVHTAGQIGLVPETGQMIEGGVEQQTEQAMKNVTAVLEAAGTKLENVIKTTIFLTDMADFAVVNRIYGGFFDDNPPARSTVQVTALPLNGLVEIETVAIITG